MTGRATWRAFSQSWGGSVGKKPEPSLLDACRALPANGKFRNCLPPDIRDQLVKIAIEKRDGKIGATADSILTVVMKELQSRGIKASITSRAFASLLSELAHGPEGRS